MTNQIKALLVSVVIFSSILIAPSSVSAQENNPISVAGYGGGRTRFVLASSTGGPPPGFFFPVMSRLYNGLHSTNNFGSNGTVSCEISRLNTLTSYVSS